jgi:hypothetical protein
VRVNAFLEVFEKKQRVDRDRRNERDREQKIHRHGHIGPKLPNRLFHAQFWSGRRRIVTRFVFARRACAARRFESARPTDSLRKRSNDRPAIPCAPSPRSERNKKGPLRAGLFAVLSVAAQ